MNKKAAEAQITTNQAEDLKIVKAIIGENVPIKKERFQDNSLIRKLGDWKEGPTFQT